MLRLVIVILGILLNIQKLYCQDFHYTQIYATPQNNNPALTGNFDFDYLDKMVRIISNYRQQWRTIKSNFVKNNTPFNSFSASVDNKIYAQKLIRSDYIGLGGTAFNDKAGDLNLSNTQISYSVSYNKVLNRAATNILTLGYSQGIVQRSINYENAFYDNQWNGTSFDPNSPTNEPNKRNILYYTTFSSGIAYTHINYNFISYRIGLSAFQLNNPNGSFNSTNGVLKTRYVAHGDLKIPLRKNELFPSCSYSVQGPTRELSINLLYKIIDNKRSFISNYVGIGTRTVGSYSYQILNDAVSLHYKINYKNSLISFSYDINSSRLNRATNGIGAFECSLIYFTGKIQKPKRLPKNFKRGKTNCPPNQRLNFEIE